MDQTYLCLLCMDELEESIKHPLCNACLEKIREDRGFSCQACKTKTLDYKEDALDSLEPVEASASNTSKTDVVEGGIRSKKMSALIDEQKTITQNLLLESEKLKSQMKVYDDFLLENMTQHEDFLHRLHELVNENDEVIKEIKGERDRLVDKQEEFEALKVYIKDKLEVLNSATSTKVAVTLIDQLDESFSGLEKWCELGQQNIPSGAIVTLSEKVLCGTKAALSAKTPGKDIKIPDYSQTDFTIPEKLAKLCQRATLTTKEFTAMTESVKKALGEGQIFAVQKTESGFRCSALSVEQDQIYLHCLKEEEPPVHAHTIETQELVCTLDKDSTVVFLDLAWGGEVNGRVTIQLLPESPQTSLFLSHCLGDLGTSYLHSKFFRKKSIGFYDYVTVGGSQNKDLGGRTSVTRKLLNDNFATLSVEGAVFFHSDRIEKPEPARFSITVLHLAPFTNSHSKSFGFPRGPDQIEESKGTLFGIKPLEQDRSSSAGTEPSRQSPGSSVGTDLPKESTGFFFGGKPFKKDHESSDGTAPSNKGFHFGFSAPAQSTVLSSDNEQSKQKNGSLFGSPSLASTKTDKSSTGIFGSLSLGSTNTEKPSTGLFGSPSLASTNTDKPSTGIFGSPSLASTNTDKPSTALFGSVSSNRSSNFKFFTNSSKQSTLFSSPSEPIKKNDELSSGNEKAKQDSNFTQGTEPSEQSAGLSSGTESPKQSTDSPATFSFGQTNVLQQKRVFGHVQKGLDLLRKACSLKNINDVEIVDCGVLLPAYKS